jgi:hypothetical protein
VSIESIDGSYSFCLPHILECDKISDIRNEIPTPDIASHCPHLQDIESFIPPLNPDADVMLLICRELIEAHHVLDQQIGPPNTPYAQKLPHGWAIIGETFLCKVHRPDAVNVLKTNLTHDGRITIFKPCSYLFSVNRDKQDSSHIHVLGKTIFLETEFDDKTGLSTDNRKFLKILNQNFHKNEDAHWSAPLPFCNQNVKIPNNKPQALKRTKTLESSLRRDPVKKENFFEFMRGIHVFHNGHAIKAPPTVDDGECWYLPIFGVYHPQKPNQLRAVFDSSEKYAFGGISLNDILLTGPDLTNSLLGILLRFRREPIAVMGLID